MKLVIADPVSAIFDIQLGYGHDEPEEYSIQSDFPLTKTLSSWTRGVTHPVHPRQHITATGEVGDGRDLIRIRVESGMVYLSRTP